MSDKTRLSMDDVQRLLENPSEAVRADTAARVAQIYDPAELTVEERRLAEAIFRAMLRDAGVRVRRALSENLRQNPIVPRDVAVGLASDVAEVAVPMLETSTVLTDADLTAIVQSQPAAHRLAVARRASLSETVSDVLVDTGDEDVVATLMANHGAEIAERTLDKALAAHGSSEKVNAPMTRRPKLPIAVAERLVTLVSDRLREYLVTHHELPPDVATDLVLQSRERATVGLLDDSVDRLDVIDLVRQLRRNGRLTATIIVRALCTGDLDFFDHAMANLAAIPVTNAHRLIHDRGGVGLRALYDRCKLPASLFPVVQVAVEVARETHYDGGPDDRRRLTERMVARVLTHFEDRFDGDNIDYLIGRLSTGRELPANVVRF